MYKINNYQIKLTTNLLTNNHINIKFINNTLIIITNPFNININNLLNKHYIKYKLTGASIVAFLFLSACNGGDGSSY